MYVYMYFYVCMYVHMIDSHKDIVRRMFSPENGHMHVYITHVSMCVAAMNSEYIE